MYMCQCIAWVIIGSGSGLPVVTEQFPKSTSPSSASELNLWGRVTHICVRKPTITGSDNGLSPGWRQAIIWTNAGMLLIWPLVTNFSEMLSEIQTFWLKKIHFKMSSAKCCPFRLGLNVLTHPVLGTHICLYLVSNHYLNYYSCIMTRMMKMLDNEIGSKFCLSAVWCQTITSTNADILSTEPLAEQTSVKFESKYSNFHSRKCFWKRCLQKCRPFCSGFNVLNIVLPAMFCHWLWNAGNVLHDPQVELIVENNLWLTHCHLVRPCSIRWLARASGDRVGTVMTPGFQCPCTCSSAYALNQMVCTYPLANSRYLSFIYHISVIHLCIYIYYINLFRFS